LTDCSAQSDYSNSAAPVNILTQTTERHILIIPFFRISKGASNPTADETDDDLIPARPATEDSLVSKQDDKAEF